MVVDVLFLFTLAFSIFVVILLVLIAWRGLRGSSEPDENEQINERSRPTPSAAGGLRQRIRPARATRSQIDNENGSDEEQEMDADFPDDPIKTKIGVKKQRKLEMKAEKKIARERELQEREERKKRMEELEKQRKMEEDRIETEEKAKVYQLIIYHMV